MTSVRVVELSVEGIPIIVSPSPSPLHGEAMVSSTGNPGVGLTWPFAFIAAELYGAAVSAPLCAAS